MENTNILDLLLIGGSATLTALQTNETLQTINLVLTCVMTGVFLLMKLIQLYTALKEWYNKAKKDGKITKEELKAGKDILEEHIEDMKDGVEDILDGKDDE